MDLSNANFSVIPTITVPHVDRPTAVDYDSKAGKLYWADRNLNVINSANNDGSNVETIIDSGNTLVIKKFRLFSLIFIYIVV